MDEVNGLARVYGIDTIRRPSYSNKHETLCEEYDGSSHFELQ